MANAELKVISEMMQSVQGSDQEYIAKLNQWFDERFDEKIEQREESKTPSMTIIATKGTLDMAYPPFILASTASALGWDISIFFTFKEDISD